MRHTSSFGCPEPLEARIAPAAVSPVASAIWKTGQAGDVFELHAGEGLGTAGDKAGAYLLFVEKGNILVFTTDLNNNGSLDENEITGIAAGDGTRIILFSDVHGDIATNLREANASFGPVLTLSDSDNNGINNSTSLKGDGLVILNKTIEKIELRTLTTADIPDQNNDGIVDDADVALRAAPTSFSIFGNIYAGKGFGLATDPTSGLIIDSTGATTYPGVLLGASEVHPTIGSIKVGTAVSGQWLSYGISRNDDIAGTLLKFIPQPGQHGADVAFVRSANATTVFNFNSIIAGDGGIGGDGGNVIGTELNADDSGGYEVIAGNGGKGPTGGHGGSITGFSDLGSHTSKVLIQSGSGGTGTTGAGGDAGDFKFETVNILGFVSINLGDGGSGFTSGGAGASLLTGVFTQKVTDYNAGAGFGTYHQSTYDPADPINNVGQIGTHQAVDFNNDVYGDFVYSTVDNSQLVVVFGAAKTDPNAIGYDPNAAADQRAFNKNRIYLSGVRNAESITVADLNGDGHLDIAVGSIDASNRSGIAVFLAKYEDLNNDGVLDSSEDLNADGINDFLGFYDVRFSPLPQLNGFDTDTVIDPKPYNGSKPLPFPVQDYLYAAGPVAISDIAAGDFDGDGVMELAVSATYQGRQVIVFMTQDAEKNDLTGRTSLTGQFYADYGSKRIRTPDGDTAPDPRLPYITAFTSGTPGHAMIEATALTTTSDHDVLLVASRDLGGDGGSYFNVAFTVDYQTRASTFAGGKYVATPPVNTGFFSLGVVDTDRGPGISLEGAFPLDFTILDYNSDGAADVIAITGDTAGFGFYVGSLGDGLGNGIDVSDDVAQNAGNYLGDNFRPNVGASIVSVDADGDGVVNQIAIFGNIFTYSAVTIQFVEGAATPSIYLDEINSLPNIPDPNSPHLSDVWYPDLNDIAKPVIFSGYNNSNIGFNDLISARFGGRGASLSNVQLGYSVLAGDGGNSIVGTGGLGGGLGIGSKLTTFTTVDPLTMVASSSQDLVGSLQFFIDGTIDLVAGKGGDGFAKGGKGGGIIGVVSRGEADVTLRAGDGGRGVSGTGGDGGSLAADSIYGGYSWTAGKGGSGSIGGNGGSIIGNGTNLGAGAYIFDSLIPHQLAANGNNGNKSFTALAGDGGSGTRGGGNGGSISSFRTKIGGITPLLQEVDGTFFRMEAGDGGNAVAGSGGKGGSISNSSPNVGSILTSDIALIAGNGGGGTRGGDGGSISNFLFQPPSTGDNVKPAGFSAVAGHGGSGTSGSGGKGGSVSSVNVPTKGVANAPKLQPYNYNRVLAGNGGSSAGALGGDGGDVFDLITSASDGGYVLIGGAGGDGLTQGGLGGSVRTSTVELRASTLVKLLVVAGDGGDASAFVPNTERDSTGALRDQSPDQGLKSFGGRVGQAGKGGSIVGFNQIGNIQAHVDLIAGNGGSSIHYGTVLDNVVYAGRGGNIANTFITGDVGNIATNVAIKSYNNIFAGETIAAFVENKIRANPAATLKNPGELSDADGNVGVVVGAAGGIKPIYDPVQQKFITQPATFRTRDGNGDLVDLTARNLLSAVAGNVDQIAVIHAARGIKILNGVVGADKPVLGSFDYIAADGVTPVTTPERNGRLVDGALIASAITDLNGNPVTLIGRVFIL